MNLISHRNRIKIIKIHYENGGSVTFRKIRDIFLQHNRLSETAFKHLVVRSETIPTRIRLGRSTEKIAAVSHNIEEVTNFSTPRGFQHFGLSKKTTWRILLRDLPYKVHLLQEMKPPDHLHYRKLAQFNQEQNAGFSVKNIFQTLFTCQGRSTSKISSFGRYVVWRRDGTVDRSDHQGERVILFMLDLKICRLSVSGKRPGGSETIWTLLIQKYHQIGSFLMREVRQIIMGCHSLKSFFIGLNKLVSRGKFRGTKSMKLSIKPQNGHATISELSQ